MKKFLTRIVTVVVVFMLLVGAVYFIYPLVKQKEPEYFNIVDIESPVKETPKDTRPYEEILAELEEKLKNATHVIELPQDIVVDVFIFMGQSNMSGNGGNPEEAHEVTEGAGYEFRVISDPTKLYSLVEPFGFYENKPLGISDGTAKRGSLVSAFVNKYYEHTNVPVVAVSCSQGATNTAYWTNPGAMGDAVNRLTSTVDWLNQNGYEVRHKYMVWLQGESDAIFGFSQAMYATNMDIIVNSMIAYGVEKCFMIRIGRSRSNPVFCDEIQKVQTEICKNDPRFMMASTMLGGFDVSYMIDEWHYDQRALNMVGEDAAKNISYYVNTGREPSMYDYKYDNEYVPIVLTTQALPAESTEEKEQEVKTEEAENEGEE